MTFQPGDHVMYEVTKQAQDSFEVPAVVIEVRPKRVLIEFRHWSDDRVVRRGVRPHKLREGAPGA